MGGHASAHCLLLQRTASIWFYRCNQLILLVLWHELVVRCKITLPKKIKKNAQHNSNFVMP
jgi:hypothetical protein